MDRITASILDGFKAERSLESLPRSELFESFAGYCVLSNEYDDEFDPEEYRLGSGGDLGIDIAAIIVNGELVSDKEEIRDLRASSGFLSGRIVLVQAKTGANFEGKVVSDLADNLVDFLSESPQLPMSAQLQDFKQTITELYSNIGAFKRGLPELVVRFVTTGTWQEDAYIASKLRSLENRLSQTNMFDRVDANCLGAREIRELYQMARDTVEAEFSFSKRVSLPAIDGVEQAYVGVVSAAEYLRLITDQSGSIRKSLFYDNVRDFQDYNPVNREIRSTLQDIDKRQRFVVMNNGITIVAREITVVGDTLRIRDYQIVNGCQTSHVLFDQRSFLGNSVSVPVRVIVSRDEDVIASITAATNSQTSVTDEDLQAQAQVHKDLEIFFESFPEPQRLYYERRSRQYSAMPNLEKTRIISRSVLTRAYAAMFLDEPWRAGRYYKELKSVRGGDIFQSSDNLMPYYTSAFAYYRLEWLFRNGRLGAQYKPARYQMLMAIRRYAHGNSAVPKSPKPCDAYCQKIVNLVFDPQQSEEFAVKLLPVIEKAVKQTEEDGILDRDTVRTQTFTDLVKAGVDTIRQ
jgi:AIPR protein